MDGLIIKKPWTDLILSGEKAVEVRNRPVRKYERIFILESGTGLCVGTVEIVRCFMYGSAAEYRADFSRHRYDIPEKEAFLPYEDKTFGWELANPRRLSRPFKYRHPKGAIIWVKDVKIEK